MTSALSNARARTNRRAKPKARTAQHRPARRRRRFRHDELIAVEAFSGFGGLTSGINKAGFTTILAANHNAYKVDVHERNHPEAEHWIADLVDPESSDYHSARDFPAGDLFTAGISCTSHSQANTQKAYEQRMSLFDIVDPEYDARVTRSEKDRATASCVLAYADEHHPRMILVECTTELQSWGPAVPGKKKVGDGTTYRWWLKQFENQGYRYRVLYLNSMFFGVPQSRDRLYIVFWLRELPAPDLDHRPPSWCGRCSCIVDAVWSWKTRVPPTGSVRYGKQYNYRCPECRSEVIPPMTPSLAALDLTNLGRKIGDRPSRTHKDGSFGPLAASTMARAQRCLERFADFPAVLMPAKAERGSERLLHQPLATQTSQQETALLTSSALMVAAGNTFEHPGSTCRTRGLDEPLWTQPATNTTGLLSPDLALAVDNFQGAPRSAVDPLPTQVGSETLGLLSARVMPNRTNATSRSLGEPMETLVAGAGSGGLGVLSSGVIPFRQNTVPTTHDEAMPTVTSDQIPGILTAAGWYKENGKTAPHPMSDPVGTITAHDTTALLFSGWYKQNGATGTETAPHPMSDPLGTLTARDTTALLLAEWRAALADVKLEDCHFRMMGPHEVGRGCGFDVQFLDHPGTFEVWGSDRDQVDGFGNAVSPQVGEWLGLRLRAALHGKFA